MNTIYYLKFFLKNISETKEYKVLEDEQDRLNNILQNRSTNDISSAFFCFDTIDGLSVCISIKDIQAVQMLFDTGVINTSSNNNTYNKDLSIILRNEKEEFPIETEDSKGIYDLTYNLDSVSEEDNMFLVCNLYSNWVRHYN